MLPIRHPVAPMLARLVRDLPRDGFLYEPKWDGFRAQAWRDGAEVDLWSRNRRPLGRYFPELVVAIRGLSAGRFVLDGEIMVVGPEGCDFAALMARLHPAASRVERLREVTPAIFVAFDLLAVDDVNLLEEPLARRRSDLRALLRDCPPPVFLTPATDDVDVASAWLTRFAGGGVDGVVAKDPTLTYQPGERAMLKVKHERTAECVVAGFRWLVDRPAVASLLLGLHDAEGRLRHVGVASAFSEEMRRDVLERVWPLATSLRGHPWEHGFGLSPSPVGRLAGSAGRWIPGEMEMDWVPVHPRLVCEVAYDLIDDRRFRFPARFRRWRPDREPRSCTFDQLIEPDVSVPELLALR